MMEKENRENGSKKKISRRHRRINDSKSAGKEEKTFVDKTKQQRIIESSQWLLKEHKVLTTKYFVETQGYRDANEILRNHKRLIITGISGQGKSYLSCQLLTEIVADSSSIKPLIISTVKEWKTLVDSSVPLGIIVDDMCGRVCVNKGELKKWTEESKYMPSFMEKHVVIFTINSLFFEKILLAMESCTLFSRDIVLNIDNILKSEERVQFVNTYLETFNLNDDEVSYLCKIREANVGFPQLCNFSKTICEKTRLLDSFSKPRKLTLNQINYINKNDRGTYCCLTLVLLSKGKLNLQSIREIGDENKTKENTVFAVFNSYRIPVVPIKILRTLKSLQGKYLSVDETNEYYSFSHDTIEEAVFFSFVEFFPEQALRECSLQLICKRCIINYDSNVPEKTTTESALNLPQCYQRYLINRFMTALKEGIPMDFTHVSEAIIWPCQAFRKAFFNECKIHFLTDKDENSLLVHAANANSRDLAIELLHELDHTDEDKRIEVTHILRKSAKASCAHHDTSLFEKICEKNRLDLSDLLLRCIQHGSINAIEFLLKSGADVNYKSNHGENLLHIASLHGRFDVAKLLHLKNANLLSDLDDHNRSIGLCTAAGGSVEILKFFLPLGLNPHDTDANGWNILHYACWYRKKAMVKYILTQYPQMIYSEAKEGLSVLLCAAFGGNVCTFKTIYELLKSSSSINEAGTTNITCMMQTARVQQILLHMSCLGGGLEMIQYFVETYPNSLKEVDKRKETQADNAEMTKYLVNMFPTILNEEDDSKRALAHYAVESGNVDVLKYLIELGTDPRCKNSEEETLLHRACIMGQLEMTKYLVETYPDMVGKMDESRNTPAHHAAESGNVLILKYLTEHGADPLSKNSEEETLLHSACINGQLEMTMYLVKKYPGMLEEVDDSMNTPAHHAAESSNVEVLQYLIKHGIDPWCKNSEEETLLHSACIDGHLEMTKYLVENYPDMLDTVDDSMSTPAHHAAESGNVEVLKYLVERNTDPQCKTSENETLLHKACINGQLEMTKHLVENYHEMLNLVDDSKSTPAHHAAESGNVEVLKYLIACGIDPWCRTSDGETLLHRACINGDLQMTTYLAETYPDMIHKVDNIKRTPAHRATESGKVSVLRYLLDSDTDPWDRTIDGETLLHIACTNGKLKMTKYLVEKFPTMLNEVDNSNRTPTHRAQESNMVAVLNYLTDRPTDPHLEPL